jgi:hypothetical protein
MSHPYAYISLIKRGGGEEAEEGAYYSTSLPIKTDPSHFRPCNL